MNRGKAAVGIDIGGTKTLIGVVDRSGNILASHRFPTVLEDPITHLNQCVKIVQQSLNEVSLSVEMLQGIGVTVPGMADSEQGMLIHAPFADWRHLPVKQMLTEKWPGVSIAVDNDVNACALAEGLFGSGNDFRHLLWVTVSTGIGAGVIIDRQIYSGEHWIAGELGHTVVEWENGMGCTCGNRGCLEAHASGTAIARLAQQQVEENDRSPLSQYLIDNDQPISAETVAQAARAGVEEARDIYCVAGRYLGRSFSYAANMLNPGAIIVGGGVSLAFDLLEESMNKEYQRAIIGDSNRSLPIMPTALGYEAGLMGAASLAFNA